MNYGLCQSESGTASGTDLHAVGQAPLASGLKADNVVQHSMNIRSVVAVGCLFLIGCSDMQPSPVAPSATSPAATVQPSPSRPAPTFTVDLGANGGIAYLNERWQSTLSVSSSDPAQGAPSSVSVRCGDAAEQIFAGFLGARIIDCTFAQAGTVVVAAAVVARTGITTTTAVTLAAQARPVPVIPDLTLTINATRISGNASAAEWRFSVSANDTVSDAIWDFGDGAGASGTPTQHVYKTQGDMVVRATAQTAHHGQVSTSKTIGVIF
jgi:hypothetical protein